MAKTVYFCICILSFGHTPCVCKNTLLSFSGGRARTVPAGSSTRSTVSKLTYTPHNDKDYGTLMCTASNEVGTQREPCVYHIILAGKRKKLETQNMNMHHFLGPFMDL